VFFGLIIRRKEEKMTENDEKDSEFVYFDGEKEYEAPPKGFKYKLCEAGGCRNIVSGTKVGKPPGKCLEHRSFRGKNLDTSGFEPFLLPETISGVSQGVINRSAKEIAIDRGMRAREICDRRKLAVALRIEKDPHKAAKLAGVMKEGEELEALILEALAPELQDLRDGKQSATAGAITVAAALLAENLLEAIFEIPISSAPAALAQLTKAIEPLGGFRKSYTQVNVIFPRAIDDDSEA
jgi:hypothetical protein